MHEISVIWAFLDAIASLGSMLESRHISGITWAYLVHFMGIFQAYQEHILGIFGAYGLLEHVGSPRPGYGHIYIYIYIYIYMGIWGMLGCIVAF